MQDKETKDKRAYRVRSNTLAYCLALTNCVQQLRKTKNTDNLNNLQSLVVLIWAKDREQFNAATFKKAISKNKIDFPNAIYPLIASGYMEGVGNKAGRVYYLTVTGKEMAEKLFKYIDVTAGTRKRIIEKADKKHGI